MKVLEPGGRVLSFVATGVGVLPAVSLVALLASPADDPEVTVAILQIISACAVVVAVVSGSLLSQQRTSRATIGAAILFLLNVGIAMLAIFGWSLFV